MASDLQKMQQTTIDALQKALKVVSTSAPLEVTAGNYATVDSQSEYRAKLQKLKPQIETENAKHAAELKEFESKLEPVVERNKEGIQEAEAVLAEIQRAAQTKPDEVPAARTITQQERIEATLERIINQGVPKESIKKIVYTPTDDQRKQLINELPITEEDKHDVYLYTSHFFLEGQKKAKIHELTAEQRAEATTPRQARLLASPTQKSNAGVTSSSGSTLQHFADRQKAREAARLKQNAANSTEIGGKLQRKPTTFKKWKSSRRPNGRRSNTRFRRRSSRSFASSRRRTGRRTSSRMRSRRSTRF